jgi:signal transduction histidine kinase
MTEPQTVLHATPDGEAVRLNDECALLASGLSFYAGPAMLVTGGAEIVWLNRASRDWLNITAPLDAPLPLANWIAPADSDDWGDSLERVGTGAVQARRVGFAEVAGRLTVTLVPVGGLRLALYSSPVDSRVRLDVTRPETVRFAQLLDAVSHELRNPLTPIVGMSEMLIDGDVGTLTDAQQRLLKHIYHASARLTAALDALLDLSRLCAGKRTVEQVEVHIRYCLERVTDILKARPQLNAYQLVADVPDRDLKCITDPRLLERTLLELIDYVLRKSPSGQSYHLRAAADDGGILISLVDLAAETSAEPLMWNAENDPYVGSAVARELGSILGLRIGTSSSDGIDCLLRVLVPGSI